MSILDLGKAALPIGKVVLVVTAVLSSYIWLDQRFNSLDRRLQVIEIRTYDRFSLSDAREWSLRLARANPEIDIPEPQRVQRTPGLP